MERLSGHFEECQGWEAEGWVGSLYIYLGWELIGTERQSARRLSIFLEPFYTQGLGIINVRELFTRRLTQYV